MSLVKCFAVLVLAFSVSDAQHDAGRKGGCCDNFRVNYDQCCVNGAINTEAECSYWWSYLCPKGLDGYLAYSQCRQCSLYSVQPATEPASEPASEPAAEAQTAYAMSSTLHQSNLQQDSGTPSGSNAEHWISAVPYCAVALLIGLIVLVIQIVAYKFVHRRQHHEADETDSKGSNDTTLEDIDDSIIIEFYAVEEH